MAADDAGTELAHVATHPQRTMEVYRMSSHNALVFYRTLSMVAFAALASTPARADDPVVDVQPQRVFVPTGFDDNDDVEIVVDGVFSNSCYRLVKGEATIDAERREVVLHPRARVASGMCLPILVPYTYVFEVGKLPAGLFTIRTGDAVADKTLSVAEATSAGPDDELYAAIDNATVEQRPDGKFQVVLEGTYTSTCMRWKGAQVVHKDPEVLEVMPVVQIVPGAGCRDVTYPFKGVAVPLPDVPPGRFLLHVRSMHGGSLNRVFNR